VVIKLRKFNKLRLQYAKFTNFVNKVDILSFELLITKYKIASSLQKQTNIDKENIIKKLQNV